MIREKSSEFSLLANPARLASDEKNRRFVLSNDKENK